MIAEVGIRQFRQDGANALRRLFTEWGGVSSCS